MSTSEIRSAAASRSEYRTAVPAAHWNAVTRRRLLSAMFSEPTAPRVVVLHAPAGHGKTSAMVQAEAACRTEGRATAWITIDSADDDVTRLSDLLHRLADSVSVPQSRDALASAADHDVVRGDLESRFATIGQPAAVFIDDLHFLHNEAAAQLLLRLLSIPVPHLRWFIGSRRPPRGLSSLVVAGDTVELRAEELRFSVPEAREFFAELGGEPLSERRISSIIDSTEGWPAALQLYRLALRASRMFGAVWDPPDPRGQQLAEYLGDNVLGFQEQAVQDFLVLTSCLDRMNVELCDAILGRTDSAEMFSLIEHRGLFLRRLSSAEGWFTYHAIFLTFLRSRITQRDPVEVERIHRAAAQWFIAHGHDEDAIHHYQSIGDHDSAADALNRWVDTLVPSGYMATVDKWLDETPREQLLKRPSLLVKILWALAFLSRNHKIGPVLDLWRQASQGSTTVEEADSRIMLCVVDVLADRLLEANRHIIGIDTAEDGDGRFRTFELGVICNARGYIEMAEGNFDRALTEFERGRELNIRAGAMFALAYSLGKAALVRLSQGYALEALERLQTARSTTSQMEGSLSEACLIAAHVATLYEVGDFETALREFEKNRDLIEVGAIHDYLVIAFRAVSRIHHLNGELRKAEDILDHAQGLAHARLWPRAARLLAVERARFAVLAEQPTWASQLLQTDAQPRSEVVRMSEEAEDEHIARIRYLICTGEHDEALRRLRPVLAVARKQDRVLRQIKLCTLAARAEHGLGNTRTAHRNLQEALDLAAWGNCRSSILDEGPAVAELLLAHWHAQTKVATTGQSYRFLRTLIPPSALDDRLDPPTPEVSCADFTSRELDVLRLAGKRLSNNEIADALFVSGDTVKYHLKNIYAKIGTNRRTEIVAVASKLDLL